VRRALPVLVVALVLAGVAPAATTSPPRQLRVLSGGHSVLASLVHVCLRHGASVDCTASPVHLRGTLPLRPGARVSLKFERSATSVTVGLQHGVTVLGPATRASGSGRRFRWTAPRSLGSADRLTVVARYGRSDSRFAAAIRRVP
jgi:hypothetical protein